MHPLLHTIRRAFPIAAVATAVAAVFAAPAVATPHQYHGAQTHPLWGGVSAAEYERELALLEEAGADSVRIDLGWSSIESDGKGEINDWYVNRADAFFAAARRHNLKVIVSLSDSPCWASSAPDRGDCSGSWWNRGVEKWAPRDAAEYGRAAGWVAARWGADLAALEVWNEPNDSAYFRADQPVADYAGLVRAAYHPVKAAAPHVPVVVGAVAHSDRVWLERLYAQGIAGHYDGLSIHPYNEWRDPDDPWQPQWKAYSFLSGVQWVRDLMVAKGDADKGLWLTEFGFSTCGNADKVCVNQQQQAEYTRDSFKIAAGWSFVRAAIVYNLRNLGDDGSRLSQYGLVTRNFARKPAYEAFKQALHTYYGPNARPGGADAYGNGDDTQGSGGFVSVDGGGRVLITNARGVTRVKLTCRARWRQRCRGKLRLRAARSSGVEAASRHLGQRRFSLSRGTRTVRVKLNRRGRRLIARRGRLRVAAVVLTKRGSAKAKTHRRAFLLKRR